MPETRLLAAPPNPKERTAHPMSPITSALNPDQLCGSWEADPAASSVSFRTRHLKILPVTGTFPLLAASAEIRPGPALARLEARISAAGFQTGNSQRDADVRSARFLDADQYPEITFSGTELARSGDSWRITGQLTAHGVTRPQTLVLTAGPGAAQGNGGDSVRFRATTVVDRTAFGVTQMPGVAGRVLRITLDVAFARRARTGS
jgi:polyisoprenoid-binding protein YceI